MPAIPLPPPAPPRASAALLDALAQSMNKGMPPGMPPLPPAPAAAAQDVPPTIPLRPLPPREPSKPIDLSTLPPGIAASLARLAGQSAAVQPPVGPPGAEGDPAPDLDQQLAGLIRPAAGQK
jgi:hypothetical protein